MEKNERKKEIEIKNSEIKKINISLHEVCKSICKTSYQIGNHIKFGTGFFIKLHKDDEELFFLMTNEHVITKDIIESNETIDVKYNYEKKIMRIKLDKNKRYIILDKEMDVALIEIIQEDEIKDKYFL